MAKIFEAERVVPAWNSAAKHLLNCANHTASNLVLEISDPLSITENDRAIWSKVDGALRSGTDGALALNTVAATIFPPALYKKYGRPGMYQKFLDNLERGRKPGSWGTYAQRMVSRAGKDGFSSINPLDMIVEKLKENASAERRNSYHSSYELGVADPEADLVRWPHLDEDGAELPTYNAAFDAKELFGFPCLSHISFKLINRTNVNMVAIYRSHHYCARALGNLIGLAQLLKFVATESGVDAGTLTCISTFAELDVKSWGGVSVARDLLK